MKKYLAALMAVLFMAGIVWATTVGDDMVYEGTVTHEGAVTTSGAQTFGSTVAITGNTTIGGTLSITGGMTPLSTVDITGNSTIGGTLGISDATTIGGATTINASFRVTGEILTATEVLTVADIGKTLFLNSATEFQTTLPAISTIPVGATFIFIVAAAPSGASYTVISGNSLENVITGGVVERETDDTEDGPQVADGDTITIADGVAVAGDMFTLISDGTKYYMFGQVNADGAITPSQAD